MKPLSPASRVSERLTVLFIVALLLFCPPLLLVVNRHGMDTLPWLPLYLFLAWGLIIALTAWLMEGS